VKRQLIIITALGLALAGTVEAQAPDAPPTPDLESTRATIGKWIATQDLILRERKDWQEGKDLLLARIGALEAEISTAETKLAESESILADLRRKQSETAAIERKLDLGSGHLAEVVTALEADVRRLHSRLPAAVQQKVAPLYRRIPEDPSTDRVSIGERFQNVIGILNEIHRANADISLVTEIRALADGKPSEVKTVYLGLAQAYFLGARGEAGVGEPAAEGWQWRAANEIAPHVSEVIEILENKGKPKFVKLPVTVR
jgi:hypothetical protein